MHGGGAKYHDYGGAHLGLPNVADGLYAIKYAVFDEKICTADELISAMKADFVGYEKLKAKLKAIPKYGMDNDDVDALAKRVMSDFADMYLSYRTRWGGTGKPVILTFVWAPTAAKVLGATADGKSAHSTIAHGVTPACSSMKCGITAAINSCGKMPFEKFSGGASTMWDFDSSIATEDIVKAILKTFMENGGQIFQGNTTPLDELIDAKAHPENYEHLMVRVGGYSARFTRLEPSLQDEIIARLRHTV
jgi:formate C-acetyltransferase